MHISVIDAAKACAAMYAQNSVGSPGEIEGYTVTHYAIGEIGFLVSSDTKGRPTYATYKKDGADAYIIAIRGSIDTESDWMSNNINISLNITPARAKETFEFVVRQRFGRTASEFVIAGHSLGGGLAQLVGYYTNNNFIAFNAPAMRNSLTGNLMIGSAGTGFKNETKSWNYSKGCVFNTSNDPISKLSGRFIGYDYEVFSRSAFGREAHSMAAVVEGLRGGRNYGSRSVLSCCSRARS